MRAYTSFSSKGSLNRAGSRSEASSGNDEARRTVPREEDAVRMLPMMKTEPSGLGMLREISVPERNIC